MSDDEQARLDYINGYLKKKERAWASEAQEGAALFHWSQIHPDFRVKTLFHIPNGGMRNGREAAWLNRQGVRAGIPDYCLPIPSGKYHSLYIELKARGRATLSEEQRDWLRLLE